MVIQQSIYTQQQWTDLPDRGSVGKDESSQLVLIFGAKDHIANQDLRAQIRTRHPHADLVFASTAGEIFNNQVLDNTLCTIAITFAHTPTRCVYSNIEDYPSSYAMGQCLFQRLNQADLNSIFLVSDGTLVNGSDLIAGLNAENRKGISISGGLAGDGDQFVNTLVGLNEQVGVGKVVAIGFYGDALKVYHSSLGGWDEFGRDRIITKADKNILYELDGKNALDLYKEYLGPFSDELPGSALLFPISIKTAESEQKLVRTILTIDEAQKSMTFAGNMPEGATVRLMKANFDKLTEASAESARQLMQYADHRNLELAILISCVGRKLVLQARTEEEVWAAKNILGETTAIAGFYSYGELSPYNPSGRCELHNQTMTITGFCEKC
ncbi:MAG: FIST N-terminal domain-containing protein [Haliscomenobacter sp.]|uniref:FIST signal transduction protein n=1 Tax=Haliscomenobacter sp. TaxID=2717303 RepID=UPI0029A56F0C|nr:FIST N-terminal domain-containing protein [Haliscomenobacter sp.]MDX2069630.1 FIST N-terminal domain-containing protein [Haliscomenobacter sp.]